MSSDIAAFELVNGQKLDVVRSRSSTGKAYYGFLVGYSSEKRSSGASFQSDPDPTFTATKQAENIVQIQVKGGFFITLTVAQAALLQEFVGTAFVESSP